MDYDDKNLFSCLGIVLFAIGSVFVGAISSGYALSTLWLWFVVPIFNTPTLSIPQAVGISIVVGLLTGSGSTESKEKSIGEHVTNILALIIRPLIVLGIGWIVTLFL